MQINVVTLNKYTMLQSTSESVLLSGESLSIGDVL